MSDQDVAKELLEINNLIGDFSHTGGIHVKTTESTLENYIK
jgi:hypothetical protein